MNTRIANTIIVAGVITSVAVCPLPVYAREESVSMDRAATMTVYTDASQVISATQECVDLYTIGDSEREMSMPDTRVALKGCGQLLTRMRMTRSEVAQYCERVCKWNLLSVKEWIAAQTGGRQVSVKDSIIGCDIVDVFAAEFNRVYAAHFGAWNRVCEHFGVVSRTTLATLVADCGLSIPPVARPVGYLCAYTGISKDDARAQLIAVGWNLAVFFDNVKDRMPNTKCSIVDVVHGFDLGPALKSHCEQRHFSLVDGKGKGTFPAYFGIHGETFDTLCATYGIVVGEHTTRRGSYRVLTGLDRVRVLQLFNECHGDLPQFKNVMMAQLPPFEFEMKRIIIGFDLVDVVAERVAASRTQVGDDVVVCGMNRKHLRGILSEIEHDEIVRQSANANVSTNANAVNIQDPFIVKIVENYRGWSREDVRAWLEEHQWDMMRFRKTFLKEAIAGVETKSLIEFFGVTEDVYRELSAVCTRYRGVQARMAEHFGYEPTNILALQRLGQAVGVDVDAYKYCEPSLTRKEALAYLESTGWNLKGLLDMVVARMPQKEHANTVSYQSLLSLFHIEQEFLEKCKDYYARVNGNRFRMNTVFSMPQASCNRLIKPHTTVLDSVLTPGYAYRFLKVSKNYFVSVAARENPETKNTWHMPTLMRVVCDAMTEAGMITDGLTYEQMLKACDLYDAFCDEYRKRYRVYAGSMRALGQSFGFTREREALQIVGAYTRHKSIDGVDARQSRKGMAVQYGDLVRTSKKQDVLTEAQVFGWLVRNEWRAGGLPTAFARYWPHATLSVYDVLVGCTMLPYFRSHLETSGLTLVNGRGMEAIAMRYGFFAPGPFQQLLAQMSFTIPDIPLERGALLTASKQTRENMITCLEEDCQFDLHRFKKRVMAMTLIDTLTLPELILGCNMDGYIAAFIQKNKGGAAQKLNIDRHSLGEIMRAWNSTVREQRKRDSQQKEIRMRLAQTWKRAADGIAATYSTKSLIDCVAVSAPWQGAHYATDLSGVNTSSEKRYRYVLTSPDGREFATIVYGMTLVGDWHDRADGIYIYDIQFTCTEEHLPAVLIRGLCEIVALHAQTKMIAFDFLCSADEMYRNISVLVWAGVIGKAQYDERASGRFCYAEAQIDRTRSATIIQRIVRVADGRAIQAEEDTIRAA